MPVEHDIGGSSKYSFSYQCMLWEVLRKTQRKLNPLAQIRSTSAKSNPEMETIPPKVANASKIP